MSVRAFIGVGSNIDPESNLVKGLRLLMKRVKVAAVSTMYRTRPLRGRDIPSFINGVWEIETDLDPAAVHSDVLKTVERECGREASIDKYGSRKIDLDLLIYGDLAISGDVTLPHPDIRERSFVAVPLLELDPALVLPGTKTPLARIVRGMSGQALEADNEFTERLRKELLHG